MLRSDPPDLASVNRPPKHLGSASSGGAPSLRLRLSFDRDRREFSVGGIIVRRFTRAAWGQFQLLDQFEAQGWPPSIVDDLQIEWDEKQRMRMKETVFRLNEGQVPRLITFHCHSNQREISWEFEKHLNSNLIPTASKTTTNGATHKQGTGKPYFNLELRELQVSGVLVYRFKAQATNLVTILGKFQHFGWPCLIFDPLGNIKSHKYGAWLKTAARRLNSCQRPWLIAFHSHPTDRSISWNLRGT